MSVGEDKRRVREVEGKLEPDCLYTREGAMAFGGLGQASLRDAKDSGIVKPIHAGRRVYYRGSELIQWIESHAAKTS